MKKFKFLFCFLILLLFFKCEIVYAAKELTCIYKGGNDEAATMLVQTSEGKILVYRNFESKTPEIDDTFWYSANDSRYEIAYDWDTKYYDKSSETLSACPEYTRKKEATFTYKMTFYFYDDKTFFNSDYELYENYNEVPNKDDISEVFPDTEDYTEEINNTDWIGVCSYKDVTLYFNRADLILDNKNSYIYTSRAGFSLTELLEYYDSTKTCPSTLYKKTLRPIGASKYIGLYYLNPKSAGDDDVEEEQIIVSESSITDTVETPNEEKIDNCLDLFSQEFIDEINSYLLIIRIFIPILLIVMGILDFTKAIFSSSEDEMNKAKAKFMKRVLAAVLVFLIPISVNLLLGIANSVWGYIDPNSCNIG